MESLIQLIIVLCVLIVAWLVAVRFSPDPLITKIVQIIIFVIALVVILRMIMPLAGISF